MRPNLCSRSTMNLVKSCRNYLRNANKRLWSKKRLLRCWVHPFSTYSSRKLTKKSGIKTCWHKMTCVDLYWLRKYKSSSMRQAQATLSKLKRINRLVKAWIYVICATSSLSTSGSWTRFKETQRCTVALQGDKISKLCKRRKFHATLC